MLFSLLKTTLITLAVQRCVSFRVPVERCSAGSTSVLRSQRQCRPAMVISVDTQQLSEALSQATSIISDSSLGVPAVEQVPYVPGDIPEFPKIVAGSAACILAYAWAAYEFGKVSLAHFEV